MFNNIFLVVNSESSEYVFYQTLIMVGITIIFFYLILWRPEKKRKQSLEKMHKNLSKGDKVVAMGILGTIHSLKEDSIVILQESGTKIEILKSAVCKVEKINS